ncbi:protein mab-21-like [Ruditapes philippinarum]|uniref:protein mab-21-like n=1 Tax=Ruditapes philippinarum TaxID=129788 RepID=UPI00295A8DEA|nr:protein mab-21-like [Ruditapes philippinarum]
MDVKTRGYVSFKYQQVDKKAGNANNMNIARQIEAGHDCLEIPMGYAAVYVVENKVYADQTYKGNLLAREIKRDLYEKVKKAIENLDWKNVVINKNAHGPAITLTIRRPGFHDISIDNTASLPCNIPVTVYGWPRPQTRDAFPADTIEDAIKTGLHIVPKGDELWAFSFSNVEKYLLNKMDGQNGCRRKVNKFLKKYAQICSSRSENGLPGVSSYIFKHAILWASEKHPDPEYWHDANIANCLFDSIDDVIRTLDSGKLPNYFNTSENILKGKDPETLRTLSNYLKEEREKLLHI